MGLGDDTGKGATYRWREGVARRLVTVLAVLAGVVGFAALMIYYRLATYEPHVQDVSDLIQPQLDEQSLREVRRLDAELYPCRASFSGTGGLHLTDIWCPEPDDDLMLARAAAEKRCGGDDTVRHIAGTVGDSERHFACLD